MLLQFVYCSSDDGDYSAENEAYEHIDAADDHDYNAENAAKSIVTRAAEGLIEVNDSDHEHKDRQFGSYPASCGPPGGDRIAAREKQVAAEDIKSFVSFDTS